MLGILGRDEEEFRCYERTLQINPRYAEVWYNKGLASVKYERFEEALVYFERATDVNPRYAEAWHNKGLMLYHLGRNEEAQEALKRAEQLLRSRRTPHADHG